MLEIVIVTQILNGIQYGILLFLLAAGLTVIFSIMNVINLAHGSVFMVAAYVAAAVQPHAGFAVAIVASLVAAGFLGWLLERAIIRKFYGRDHLDQVLVTFGLVLFFNELVRVTWGTAPVFVAAPAALDGSVSLVGDLEFPAYRLAILAVGVAVAIGLYVVIHHSRIGIWIRAGAWNRTMVEALGVDINKVFTLLFVFGSVLAGLAGVAAAPLLGVQSGMGDGILIQTFVVIVIGGIGSVKGAFIGAMMIGVLDTAGRILLPLLFSMVVDPIVANGAGPAITSMLTYLVMALVLVFSPQGLFSVHGTRK